MVVMILEKVPRSLRGVLTRWMLEVDTGVFVGRLSARVRDLLWKRAVAKAMSGRVCQIWTTNNEQGFDIRLYGYEDRMVMDIDGLQWVAFKNVKWKKILGKHLRRPLRQSPRETGDTSEV
jgi:CRISPR-associated protein Cas2